MYILRKDNETYKVEDFSTEKYTLSITRLYVGKETTGHKHDHDEIYCVVSGSGKIIMVENDYDIMGGQFWYIPAGKFHKVINTGQDMLIFVCAWCNDGD